jgi:hypothetical protein
LSLPVLALLLMGCGHGWKKAPPLQLGTATLQAVEYQAGAFYGPKVRMLHVYRLDPDGKVTLIDAAKASSGGGIDSLVGTGKLLDAAGQAAPAVLKTGGK